MYKLNFNYIIIHKYLYVNTAFDTVPNDAFDGLVIKRIEVQRIVNAEFSSEFRLIRSSVNRLVLF